jgi:hypothetical protein
LLVDSGVRRKGQIAYVIADPDNVERDAAALAAGEQ